jgi:dCMP deaminase
VLSTGYNGKPRGFGHCIQSPCEGSLSPSGTNLDSCEAVHAEQNALLQCKNVNEIHSAYLTDSPCMSCVKLLLNTSCSHIHFLREYPHPQAKEIWLRKPANYWIHRDVEKEEIRETLMYALVSAG